MADRQKNLKPAAHCLTVEEASKGGQMSGVVRRERADLRKEIQNLLDGDFKVKGKNKKLSGAAAIAYNLFSIALDTNNSQAVKAIKIILDNFTGTDSNGVTLIIAPRNREDNSNDN